MSVYAINKLCHDALHDLTFREALKRDPAAAIGSGSFSLEIGGPKIPPGERACTPDPEWAKHVQALMEAARIDDLVEEATFPRLMQAGNIGGELLNWVAMLGVIGARKPRFIKPQIAQGHAYGVWRWN